ASLSAVVVYDGELAAEEIRSRAGSQRVNLVSLEEYRGLIDFRSYSNWQNNRLKRDGVYPPSLYVEQRADISVGREERPSKGALSELVTMVDGEGARFGPG